MRLRRASPPGRLARLATGASGKRAGSVCDGRDAERRRAASSDRDRRVQSSESLAASQPREAADILEFQLALLEDEDLSSPAFAEIEAGASASQAWERDASAHRSPTTRAPRMSTSAPALPISSISAIESPERWMGGGAGSARAAGRRGAGRRRPASVPFSRDRLEAAGGRRAHRRQRVESSSRCSPGRAACRWSSASAMFPRRTALWSCSTESAAKSRSRPQRSGSPSGAAAQSGSRRGARRSPALSPRRR